jgi:hypothetical protein
MDFIKHVSAPSENNFDDKGVSRLPVGTHSVKVHEVYIIDDRKSGLKNPIEKKNLPEWLDATPQMAVVFHNKQGVAVRRFNGKGFVRFDELAKKDRKSYDELGSEGYAVDKVTKMRLEDTDRSASCANIVNQFFEACALPEGSGYRDLVSCELNIIIEAEEFDGKTSDKVTGFRVLKQVAVKQETY